MTIRKLGEVSSDFVALGKSCEKYSKYRILFKYSNHLWYCLAFYMGDNVNAKFKIFTYIKSIAWPSPDHDPLNTRLLPIISRDKMELYKFLSN